MLVAGEIYEAVEPRITWSQLIAGVKSDLRDASSHVISLVAWIATDLDHHDQEVLAVHAPALLLDILESSITNMPLEAVYLAQALLRMLPPKSFLHPDEVHERIVVSAFRIMEELSDQGGRNLELMSVTGIVCSIIEFESPSLSQINIPTWERSVTTTISKVRYRIFSANARPLHSWLWMLS